MSPRRVIALSIPFLLAMPAPSHAGDWRSKYTTGNEFEACCGHKDCRTGAALGNPEIVRRADGGYRVRVKGYWIKYDFPAVHVSEDSNTWICYLETGEEPEPLCLFLPPGVT